MNLLKLFCFGIIKVFALFLPIHGLITVILPEPFRYWKEIFLLFAIIILIIFEIRNLYKTKKITFKSSEYFAISFIIWSLFLAINNENIFYSLIAWRYLSLFFITFFIFSRLKNYLLQTSKTFIKKGLPNKYFKDYGLEIFAKNFIIISSVSVLFAFWISYLGGDKLMLTFYSNTISSWVPGQVLPIYHKIGEIIRWQGGSSGPIEFSHLLLIALFLISFIRLNKSVKVLAYFIILLGIYFSYSRTAIIGAMLILISQLFFNKNFREILHKIKKAIFSTKYLPLSIISLVLFFGFLISQINFQSNFINRMGTSDHFTRPIEALALGFENPILGNIGSIGPSARSQNLAKKNDDKAFIAENIFADIFVQTGLVGLFLVLGFFISLWRNAFCEYKWLIFTVIFLGFWATIFDMTPISICFGIILAFSQKVKS